MNLTNLQKKRDNTNQLSQKCDIIDITQELEDRNFNLQEQVVQAIDEIIEDWISDFTDKHWKKWNYHEDTIWVWNEMKLKSDGAEWFLNYFNSLDDEEFELDESHILWYIEMHLSLYRQLTFKVLESKYIKSKKS